MFYEHHRSGGNRYLYIGQEGPLFSFALHLHKSFELIAVQDGALSVQISGQSFRLCAGEAALIFPGQPHSYSPIEEGHCRMMIFSEDYLPDLKNEHRPVFRPDPSFFDQLSAVKEEPFAVKSLLYGLAAEYVRGAPWEGMGEDEALVCEIAAYMDRHFTENLTLKQIAEQFGYNYRYMSGLFNRHFGANFPNVVNQFRVNLACDLLRKGNYSITEIASRCGFDSQRNFNRVFKEITGKTPKEMKK